MFVTLETPVEPSSIRRIVKRGWVSSTFSRRGKVEGWGKLNSAATESGNDCGARLESTMGRWMHPVRESRAGRSNDNKKAERRPLADASWQYHLANHAEKVGRATPCVPWV